MKKFGAVLVLVLVLSFGFGFLEMEASTTTNWHYEPITVHSGDTLWSVADRWTENDEDIRQVISRIKKANNLANNEHLYPGQKLVIPVAATNTMLAQK